MPVFFQQQINENTRLGVWKIEETEEFFKGTVPQHGDVTHQHKRFQHLAGRFLLQFLFPDFPNHLIQIADTRKPYLPEEEYQFSISHCGDYAAAIVSTIHRVGIDIEMPVPKIQKIAGKFLREEEFSIFNIQRSMFNNPFPASYSLLTVLWSAKESIFKWYGDGGVNFRQHIHLLKQHEGNETIDCFFSKNGAGLKIHYHEFEGLVLAWVLS